MSIELHHVATPALYRAEDYTVQAMPYTRGTQDTIRDWLDDHGVEYRPYGLGLRITWDGVRKPVGIGDWLIRSDDGGGWYPVTSKVFRTKYSQTEGGWRSRPTLVQAMQYTEETRAACWTWMERDGATWWPDPTQVCTPQGRRAVRPGWWIVKGVVGEWYPAADEVFRRRYRPA